MQICKNKQQTSKNKKPCNALDKNNKHTCEQPGQMQGMGKYEYATGDRYDGQFHFNKKDGTGTYVWKDKSSYVGQWKNDLREGYGVYKWTNSSTYAGFWKEGKIIDITIGETPQLQIKIFKQ